jgi:hypothetical protein
MPSCSRARRRNSLGACRFSSAVENEKNRVFAPSSRSNSAVAGSVPAMQASSTCSPGYTDSSAAVAAVIAGWPAGMV